MSLTNGRPAIPDDLLAKLKAAGIDPGEVAALSIRDMTARGLRSGRRAQYARRSSSTDRGAQRWR